MSTDNKLNTVTSPLALIKTALLPSWNSIPASASTKLLLIPNVPRPAFPDNLAWKVFPNVNTPISIEAFALTKEYFINDLVSSYLINFLFVKSCNFLTKISAPSVYSNLLTSILKEPSIP